MRRRTKKPITTGLFSFITMEIPVIYKDPNLLVLNKPAGLLTHPSGQKAEEPSVAGWLLKNYPEARSVGDDPVTRPGIVHRLDKETSGALVVARNQETFDYLKSLFQKHLAQKTYLALVFGKLAAKEGVINKPIGIKSGSVKRSIHSSKMSKEAITEYRVVKFLKLGGKEFTLLSVTPKTGRTHQIRVHLAAIGHPVMGDKLYGGKRSKLAGLERQFLHAQSLEFTMPGGERMKFEADLPEDLKSFLKSVQ